MEPVIRSFRVPDFKLADDWRLGRHTYHRGRMPTSAHRRQSSQKYVDGNLTCQTQKVWNPVATDTKRGVTRAGNPRHAQASGP